MDDWVSDPDAVASLVRQWAGEHPDLLEVESRTQWSDRDVWALTVTDRAMPPAGKRHVLCFKPHAHEPAPLAAQMNVLCQLLTGRTLGGRPSDLARDRWLAEVVICFLPDANPAGTAAAPVAAWDGSQYTNEEFGAWMRGVDPRTGGMWKRVDLWDDTREDPLPLRYGIVYEQISAHEYVEPNRQPRSSLMQWLTELRTRHSWDRMLDLHQTEFVGSMHNAMAILPTLYEEQSTTLQETECGWAEAVLAAWGEVPGGRPIPRFEPLNYTGEERQYFVNTFGPIYADTAVLMSEVQNNSLLTPPPVQQRLCETAIAATVNHALDKRR
jgi:hypothetical protein